MNNFLRPFQCRTGAAAKIWHGALAHVNIITFCGFSMGRNQYWAGKVYDLCVYYMTGNSQRLKPKMVLWRSLKSNLRPLVYKA